MRIRCSFSLLLIALTFSVFPQATEGGKPNAATRVSASVAENDETRGMLGELFYAPTAVLPAGQQRFLEQDDAQPCLAGAGHAEDHAMGGEVAGLV